MSLMERARQLIAGARAYRFDGEQANHADLLRERRVSLSMMAGADAENPDQQRMASEIEHDAEARLTVLLGKPQLTLEEKRERDAIQTALQQRRAGFDAQPVIVARESGWRPTRFLGAITGNLALYGGIAAAVGVVGILGWWQLEVAGLKHARDRACRDSELVAGANTTRRPCIDLGETQRQLEHSRSALAEATRMVREADQNASRTAETLRRLEQQRATRAAQQRRTQRELEALRNGLGEPPELGLHDPQPTAAGPGQN